MPDPEAARSELESVGRRLRRLTGHLVSRTHAKAELDEVVRGLDVAISRLSGGAPLVLGRPHPTESSGDAHRVFGPVLGVANPLAPPLQLTIGEEAQGRGTLSRAYEGPRGFVHGGVSALLLDEVTAKVPQLKTLQRVTRSLAVEYRRPVPLEVELLVRGRYVSRSGREIVVEGTISRADHPEHALVTARTTFVVLDDVTARTAFDLPTSDDLT